MSVYAKHALAGGSYSLLEVEETLRIPLAPELLQLITTFPFNVILAVTAVLVIGTILAFTRKPTRSKKANVDVNGQPMQKVDEKMHHSVQEANIVGRPAQEVEEEMPQRFEGNKDGVVKLYNWFYRFAQKRLNGITDNMTPRELESVVLGMIPSDGVSALEYLVTSFEIANYSHFKITKEMVDKSLRAIEVLRNLIENGSSYVHDHDLTNVESSPNINARTA
jgi:hypothetical protein